MRDTLCVAAVKLQWYVHGCVCVCLRARISVAVLLEASLVMCNRVPTRC
jgi:hypothetical protein